MEKDGSKSEVPGLKLEPEKVKGWVDKEIRQAVEEVMNAILEQEVEELVDAEKYERTDQRKDYRNGHRQRKLFTRVGEVNLKIPRTRILPFTTAIVERYRRREASVEEALIEMYLQGVSTRRVSDITEALWDTSVSPQAVSDLNKRVYERLDVWRMRPLKQEYPYLYLDGLVLSRRWSGEVKNFSILVAVGVAEDGKREVIGISEGSKEDKDSWLMFLRYLKTRGLKRVHLATSDKCLGLVEALKEVYPDAQWQRCIVHFYRNVFTKVPRKHMRYVGACLKAIHAQESRESAQEKASSVIEALEKQFPEATKIIRNGIEETLTYYHYPEEHWRRIRTNNPLERLLREVRRRTDVVGSFPNGRSALMLATARVRWVTQKRWSSHRYLNIELLKEKLKEETLAKTG